MKAQRAIECESLSNVKDIGELFDRYDRNKTGVISAIRFEGLFCALCGGPAAFSLAEYEEALSKCAAEDTAYESEEAGRIRRTKSAMWGEVRGYNVLLKSLI